MKAPLRKSLALAFSAIIAAVSLGSAFGQKVKIGEKPAIDDLPSPQFGGAKNKSFKPLNWLEIEAKLNLQMEPMPTTKVCDKLTIKWYIAVKNPEKSRTFLLFTKDVEHVNVPLEEEVFSSVFLSPASLRRITGTTNGGRSSVEKVGYEVLINGTKVLQGSSEPSDEAGWWNVPSQFISRSDVVPLLNKNETPFRDMWWDRYPEISVERR